MPRHLNKITLLAAVCAAVLTAQAQSTPITPSTATAPSSATAVVAPSAYPSGVLVNYVRTKQAAAPITDAAAFDAAAYTQVKEATQYLDGLGRPIQTVSRQATPLGKDMVSPIVYDAFGRETYKYMPYVDAATDGRFKMNPFAAQASDLQNRYTGENVFYGKTVFDASPLNRPIKTFAPGNSWAGSENSIGNEHATSMQYLINDANDAVRIWTVTNTNLVCTSNMDATDVPSSTTTYGAGQLYKNVTTDEHSKQVVEYKDKEGKVVLKKVQIYNNVNGYPAHEGWLCTYYVYDDFGLLRFVIPPKAIETLRTPTGNWQLTTDMVSELCFRYAYDGRNRMIAKKVPGAGWVYMVYDKRDRLTYTQDANMRSKNQWLATLYDQLNRPKTTGMITYSGCRQDLQDYVNTAFEAATATDITTTFTAPPDLYVDIRENGIPTYRAINAITFNSEFISESGAEFETILGAGSSTATTILTSNYNPFPAGANFIALTVIYYDDYPSNNKAYSTVNNYKLDDGGNAYAEALPNNASTLTKGMTTMAKVRVLADPNDLSKGHWLETVTYYDDKGRAVQVQSDNAKTGVDISTMRYDFSGKVLTTYQVHRNPAASTTVSTKTNMLYDHAGRVLSISKTLNDNTATTRLIARNNYDELGQLLTKRLGQKSATDTSVLEVLDYSYNIRGWLQGINKAYANTNTPGNTTKWFGMQLSYDYGFTQSQYNGNIAGTIWKTRGSDEQRAYGYDYDAANRLLKGDFTQYTNGWNTNAQIDFSMKMGDGRTPSSAYDANGNILAMTQYGFKIGGNAATPIDDLKYTYFDNSNKIKNVVDLQNDAASALGDFKTAASHPQYTAIKQGIHTATDYNNNKANIYDYGYDLNGNMISDRNKGINGSVDIDQTTGGAITYNHLNLPNQITVAGKGTITYTYDAAGNKLRKTTVDNTVSPAKTTTTDYMGGGVYENDALQFIGHEEGRYRPITQTATNGNASWAFDYFIKDHLGNVRMVLTDEQKQDIYPAATLEGDINQNTSAVSKEADYYNIDPTKIVDKSAVSGLSSSSSPNNLYPNNNAIPNNNPNATAIVNNNSDKVYQLNGNTNKTGLGIVLKVMAGDKLDIFGKSYYFQNNAGSGDNTNLNLPVLDLLTNLLSGNSGSIITNVTHGAVTPAQLNTSTGSAANGFITRSDRINPNTTVPRAYINYMFFDEQMKFVGGNFSPVGGAGTVKDYTITVAPELHNIAVPKNGFVYVYCSNESPINVFFDNLQVTHTKGPLVEETHYYPFGLTMSGISSKEAGGLTNKRKFNSGNELQSTEFSDGSGLEMYDAHYRMLDPQIGRFWQLDPLAGATLNMSPFAFANNNPILLNDPFGLIGDSTDKKGNVWKGLQDVTVTSHKKQSWGGFYWPSSTASERKEWKANQNTYYNRVSAGQPVNQKGDRSSYTSSVPMYKRWDAAENEWHRNSIAAIVAIASPVMVEALVSATAPAVSSTMEAISANVLDESIILNYRINATVNYLKNKALGGLLDLGVNSLGEKAIYSGVLWNLSNSINKNVDLNLSNGEIGAKVVQAIFKVVDNIEKKITF